jgi:hypothetical protein
MSIFVEGFAATSVTYSTAPRSVLSARFYGLLPPHRRTPHLLLTTATGTYHPISFPLMFTISAQATSDVELGLDWSAFLRDSLIALDYHVDSTFNAWRFLTLSTHPLSTRMHSLHSFPPVFNSHPIHLAPSSEPIPHVSSHHQSLPATDLVGNGGGEHQPAI